MLSLVCHRIKENASVGKFLQMHFNEAILPLCFYFNVSEITHRFQTARREVRQLLLQYLLPWLHNMELVDPNVPPPSNPLSYYQVNVACYYIINFEMLALQANYFDISKHHTCAFINVIHGIDISTRFIIQTHVCSFIKILFN